MIFGGGLDYFILIKIWLFLHYFMLTLKKKRII